MASTQAHYALDQLEHGEAQVTKLLNKVYKLKPMVNAVARRIDKYSTGADLSYSDDASKLMVNMSTNRKLVPKCLSLMLLHGWFKVTFFHWFYWRYLDRHYSQQDMSVLLTKCFEINNIGFFLSNIGLIFVNNQMIEKIAKANILTTGVVPGLEAETTSLSPSTDK